jgi:D-alanyl-D-alanine dipeptidase
MRPLLTKKPISIRAVSMAIGLLTVIVVQTVARRAYGQVPDDFVDVRSVVSDIALDIRYATPHNFVGRRIPGYKAAKCLLTRQAAEALARVQTALRESGLGLKVYDCYRPQAAVDAFVEWGRDLNDQAMKAEFYPSVDKRNLFRDGYIAERSGHSRGSTVDLTIVALPMERRDERRTELFSCEAEQSRRFADASIDMGTGYDCFSPRSHTLRSDLSAAQRANRLLLKHLMESNGFINLPEEWWHFTLSAEPHPNRYFDFPIE